MKRRSVRLPLLTVLIATVTLVAANAPTLASAAPSVGAASVSAPSFHSADGLTLDSVTSTDPRLWRLTVSTDALAQPVKVNVLLPTGYASSDRRYPSLYLEYGTSGTVDDWLTKGNAEAATASYPMIVVIPDSGYNGNGGSWFTNWVDQHTPLGTANWETFHINQLIPFIDTNLRTINSRSERAIAGLSQGGFGATSYAARHPDLFGAVASFSGAPDIESNPVVKAGGTAIISATASGLDGVQPNAFFGDPILNDINWQGHNPANLVTNLRDTNIRLWTGNGLPGPLDTPASALSAGAAIESVVHLSTLSFAQVAKAAHVPYVLDDYGPGTHSWPYWARDLIQWLPHLAQVLTSPAAAPTSISYRSVDKTWSQWGWTVANHRFATQAFSGLSNASARGFTFRGRSATVTTPPVYAPGSRHTLSVSGGRAPATAVADRSGRLSIAVRSGLLNRPVVVAVGA